MTVSLQCDTEAAQCSLQPCTYININAMHNCEMGIKVYCTVIKHAVIDGLNCEIIMITHTCS